MAALKIAFEPPHNQGKIFPLNARPIDLVHLACRTVGGKDGEGEVLRRFSRQARADFDALSRGRAKDRTDRAGRLSRAARSIGAGAIADAAEKVGRHPHDESALALLAAAVTEAEDFISGLSR